MESKDYISSVIDIEFQLEKARAILKAELLHEMNKMETKNSDLPEKKRKILLISTWRSGSTFVGELISIQECSTALIHFPILTNIRMQQTHTAHSYNNVLSEILNCHFSQAYLETIDQRKPNFTMIERLYKVCKNEKMCFKPEFVSSFCQSFPIQFAKTVRYRVEDAQQLLKQEPDLKIVVLFRDPRATFNSRKSLDWCMESTVCGDPETICNHMDRDVEATYQLNEDFPGRIHLLRYEDISLSPLHHTKALFAFLQLPFSKAMERFVEEHTMVYENSGNHSTYPDSRSHVFKWRTTLEWHRLQSVQKFCSKALSDLGYRRLESEAQQGNESINLPTKTDDQVWKYTF